MLGSFGSICVSIFMFLGGYGLYLQFSNGNLSLIHKAIGLYKSYWKVFIIFVPIGLIFFRNQGVYCIEPGVYQAFTENSLSELISNFIGVSSSYNREWWFFLSFLFSLLMGYVYASLTKKINNLYIEVLIVISLYIAIRGIFPNLSSIKNNFWFNGLYINNYLPIFILGTVSAKYNVIEKARNILSEYIPSVKFVISLLGIPILIYIRNYILFIQSDIIIVPLFIIFSLELISFSKYIKNFFILLGKNSTNMWLLHSFYCYYFASVQKIVYLPKYWIFILCLLTAMSLISAIAIDLLYKLIFSTFNKLKNLSLKKRNAVKL